jgi:Protein of unknown function (DUF3040)
MALSMDEQRMLDEIERRLADEDPVLAARLTSFGPPGVRIALRSRRGRMLASLIALITLAVIAVTAFAIVPLGLRHPAQPRPSPAFSQPASTTRTRANSQPTTTGDQLNGTLQKAAKPGASRSATDVGQQP